MIEGINIRCNVGGFEVLRSPCIRLIYRRAAVVTRAEIDLADNSGELVAKLEPGQAVKIRFGYRGGANLWHEWQGTISGKQQNGLNSLRILAVGQEQKLLNTRITQSFQGEPAKVVARRLLATTGLPVGNINIPADILPHIVFSDVTVARAIKQLEQSLVRSFGYDFSKHSLWLGQAGLTWSDKDEPGDIYVVATAENLLSHDPAETPAGLKSIKSALLPGLTHSMRVRIRDVRRGISEQVRAQDVCHELGASGNITTILYGTERGWG